MIGTCDFPEECAGLLIFHIFCYCFGADIREDLEAVSMVGEKCGDSTHSFPRWNRLVESFEVVDYDENI